MPDVKIKYDDKNSTNFVIVMKIWISSAIALLATNLVVVGIVAFLIHRDSVAPNPNQSLIEQRQLATKSDN